MSCDANSSLLWLKGSRIPRTTIAEVHKMTPVDLFGLVGGYLGLFVGVSLTTIFEFFDFGLTSCHSKMVRKERARKTQNPDGAS